MNKISALPLSADTTIGFLGAGQLARMSAAVAMRLGMRTAVFSGSGEDAVLSTGGKPVRDTKFQPLEWMTPLRFTGSFDDEDALVEFARVCDVVTLENEFLDGELLQRVRDRSGTPMWPSPESFLKLESKWLEKETFRKAGIPVTPYGLIQSTDAMASFGEQHGYPYVLKSSKGGYDGYGNRTVRNPGEAADAFRSLGGDAGHELIAEAFIPFHKELAVQIARNQAGTAVYPCCETIQQGHICKTVIAPAPIDKLIAEEACRLAVEAVEAIDGIGLYAFEFFLTDDGRLYLNESAPRPHNSGHYTIEGCITSQFENHIRAVMGLPPGPAGMRVPVAVMENILGTRNGPAIAQVPVEFWTAKEAHLHIYGKESSRIGRKMGHLTVLGEEIIETAGRAADLASKITL
jgi:5-(carboxyamino)imidazole ribonucleotide synthase